MTFGRLGALGAGFGRLGAIGSGARGPTIQLSSATISDTASIGDVVGTLSVTGGSGSYTFTLTDDAGGLFAIDVAAVEVAGALTAGSYSITVEVDTGFGAPFSKAFLITVTHEVIPQPDAPVLTWVSDSSTALPTFSALFDSPVNGDEVTLQLDTDVAFGSPDEYVTTIDGGPLDFSGVTPLSNAAWYARIKHKNSAWSNVESKTISAATAPVNSVAPAISGNTQVGQTLTTTDGTWSNSPTGYAYQWKRDGSDISGATSGTYLLAEADAGADITCAVTASNAGGAGSPATSNSLSIDVYVVFLAHIEDAADATSYSGGVWNGISLGVAASNRKIVVGVDARNTAGTGVLSSLGVAGNATTTVVSQLSGTNQNKAYLCILDLPTGTSGDLTPVWSTSQSRCGAGVWALYGAGSSTASDTDTSQSDPGSVTLTVPAKGVAIGLAMATGTITATWTNITEDFDAVVETGIQHSGAHLNSNAGGNIAMQCDWSSAPGTISPTVFASWGP